MLDGFDDQGKPRLRAPSPLLFDLGQKWEYGSNIDWCGQVVEGIRRKRLEEVLKERVFGPLGNYLVSRSASGSHAELVRRRPSVHIAIARSPTACWEA